MKIVHFVAAVTVLFAAAVSAAPGSDPNPTVPAAVKPDSAPTIARPGYCHCLAGFDYPCVPAYRCAAAGYACAGPC
ncbi:hypothetical protein GQ42DRAFT_164844 [Ramicandelaber brevisporus]|nr:hypothetical protein GQ42DRAFT_164844 [Ramicandelaber brevisporus]